MSAVIATRSRPTLLRAAVGSVGGQTRPPDEVLVVNDGGPVTDTPFGDLRAVAAPAALRVTCLPASQGHVAARNLAIAMVTGDALALLDDDDLWLPDHLADLTAALSAGADLAYSDAELVFVDRRAALPMPVLGRRLFALEADSAFARRYNPVVPSAMVVRRSLLERLGGFHVAMGHHWDWDFLLRAFASGAVVRRVARASVVYTLDRGGDNQSARTGEMRESVRALGEHHALATQAAHTFWTMLDEPDVKARLAPSERPWSGAWPGLIAAQTPPR